MQHIECHKYSKTFKRKRVPSFVSKCLARNSKGFSECIQWQVEKKWQFSAIKWIYLWNSAMLLLITNRKSHVCFWLLSKSVSLDDLEWPLCTQLHYTFFTETTCHAIMNKDGWYYQWRNIVQRLQFHSGNIRFAHTRFAGSLEWASDDSELIEKSYFKCFLVISINLWNIIVICTCCPSFTFLWPQTEWPWMTLNGSFVKFCFQVTISDSYSCVMAVGHNWAKPNMCQVFLAKDTDVGKIAVNNKLTIITWTQWKA